MLGRNGVGKSVDAARRHRHQQCLAGEIVFDNEVLKKAAALQARPHGHRLRAAGPRNLPAADGQGKPRDRLCRPQARSDRNIPGLHLRPLPRAEVHAGPARW